jgi:hypothetical protein
MDLTEKSKYLYRKYWKFVPFSLWEWIGKNISLYDNTYFQRYEHLKTVKRQLEDSFEKVRLKFGYDSIEDMLEKKK